MRILTGSDVRAALPMPNAIEAMRRTFGALSGGQCVLPARLAVRPPGDGGTLLVMPAAVAGAGMGAKLVSVFPGNPARQLPRVQAMMLLLDASTGEPAALLDGTALTALRTGAASGLATELLAQPRAASLAVFGAGAQAETQIEGVCCVRRIEQVSIYAPTRAHAEALAGTVAGRAPVPAAVEVASSPREAVAHADVICAATTSATPVFNGADVRPGTHINGVGSFTAKMREIDPGLLRYARVVVDQRAAALAEAGEVMACIADGSLAESDLVELGDIVTGIAPGRTRLDEITVFKSVGLAVQDVVAAAAALSAAAERGLGTAIDV